MNNFKNCKETEKFQGKVNMPIWPSVNDLDNKDH